MNEVVVVKNLKKEIELAQGNVLEVLSDISFEPQLSNQVQHFLTNSC